MKLSVKVKTNAREDAVRVEGDVYIVSVKALPIEGRANEAIERVIATYFKVAPSTVRVVSGKTTKLKIVEVL